MPKSTILSVDDDDINQEIIKELLESDYQVEFRENGQQCIDYLKSNLPDLILLDVNMPELNGLEVCQLIRNDSLTSEVPVIMVSALVTPADRIAGYDAGCDDYITKPFECAELKSKIKLLLKQKTVLDTEKHEKARASRVAMMAMLNSSEIGALLMFMQKMLSVNDLDGISRTLYDFFTGFKISGCVMFNLCGEYSFWFSDDKERPIEQDILKHAFGNQSCIEFSGRAIFNGKYASLLVRSIPEDEEKAGRYKEHLLILIKAISVKIEQIQSEFENKSYDHRLEYTFMSIADRLGNINNLYRDVHVENMDILNNLSEQVDKAFSSLGLDEKQEAILMGMFKDAEKEMDITYKKGIEAEATFKQITDDLNSLLR